MKRSIPLIITALGGFVLIVAYFIPAAQGWGEVAAIWFDILAAIAFILGGGNLLKVHLRKVSDRKSGWGYSGITVIAFLTVLAIGLLKIGSPPAPRSEHYGQTWVHLPLASLPDAAVFRIEAEIPERADGRPLPTSVRMQIGQEDNEIVFRGWMRANQSAALIEYKDELRWRCNIEKLANLARPAGILAGRMAYYSDHDALSFSGHMTEEHRQALLAMNGDDLWAEAVNDLFEDTQRETQVVAQITPDSFAVRNLPADVEYDGDSAAITLTGPMTPAQRDALAGSFPVARPLNSNQQNALLNQIRSLGPVSPEQEEVFRSFFAGSWTVQLLRRAMDEAGNPREVDKTWCEMYEEQQAGAQGVNPTKWDPTDFKLNDAQLAALDLFAADESMTAADLADRLEAAGDLKPNQRSALRGFLDTAPTTDERDMLLCLAMMKATEESGDRLTLNEDQRDSLLADYRDQQAWRRTVSKLFLASHTTKFPWSGEYRALGSPFWYFYEYAFKPLTATMFAMLAFYVASAAFRAFRAKNFEAILLLGTAFIILLGRTAAGPVLTSWLPDSLAGLRIENLTVYIMSVFNTAGNRAIMIGIALGIASTSLKVLLGVDRSYLGSGED